VEYLEETPRLRRRRRKKRNGLGDLAAAGLGRASTLQRARNREMSRSDRSLIFEIDCVAWNIIGFSLMVSIFYASAASEEFMTFLEVLFFL